MIDNDKYAEEQEEELDEILLQNGYTEEQLNDLYPEEKEAIIYENGFNNSCE